jgi:hypothetical protein
MSVNLFQQASLKHPERARMRPDNAGGISIDGRYGLICQEDLRDSRTSSLKPIIDRYYEDYLSNENYENHKHQKANIKQIPITEIQISKQTGCLQIYTVASSPVDPVT